MSSHPASASSAVEQSFKVHMQSLTDFAHELSTQLDGLAKPSHDLASIAEKPLHLGAFPEADGLAQTHSDAINEMCDLLGQVKQAIGFAHDVTRVVAGHYAETDKDIASAIGRGI